ncbi:MAG: RNase J family beta-CASP ribonuclease [archaeon]
MRIYTIGGYSEVGKNMTAVQLKDDVIVFDAGVYLPPIVELEEREKVPTEKSLRTIGALPQDTILDRQGLRNKVRAILLGHAHLDHIGAIPYIGNRFNADIVGSPFTMEVLKIILNDEKAHMRNQLKSIQPNSTYTVNGKKKYQVEFLNITHSTIQTCLIALHTNEGVVLYANDFKLDNTPVLGKKPNYEALKRIAKEGVKALIVDSLYADTDRKTPSEKVARTLLEEVMLTTDNKENGIMVTTFSSHIARLKSIVDFGKQLNRKIVFAGRSLNKYVTAAKRAKMCPFQNDIQIFSYRRQVEAALKKVNEKRSKYLLVCTGHQGEPGAMLDKISRGLVPINLHPNDHVIFSSSTIPTEVSIANRRQLEKRLKSKGVRIFDNVHTSGHAGREDLRDFINLVKPQHIIPAHGDIRKLSAMAELASELGYKLKKDCHIMEDLQYIDLK